MKLTSCCTGAQSASTRALRRRANAARSRLTRIAASEEGGVIRAARRKGRRHCCQGRGRQLIGGTLCGRAPPPRPGACRLPQSRRGGPSACLFPRELGAPSAAAGRVAMGGAAQEACGVGASSAPAEGPAAVPVGVYCPTRKAEAPSVPAGAARLAVTVSRLCSAGVVGSAPCLQSLGAPPYRRLHPAPTTPEAALPA